MLPRVLLGVLSENPECSQECSPEVLSVENSRKSTLESTLGSTPKSTPISESTPESTLGSTFGCFPVFGLSNRPKTLKIIICDMLSERRASYHHHHKHYRPEKSQRVIQAKTKKRKISPKTEVFGRTSLRTSGQKLRSGPPNPGKTSISARACRADVHKKKKIGLKNFRLIFRSLKTFHNKSFHNKSEKD